MAERRVRRTGLVAGVLALALFAGADGPGGVVPEGASPVDGSWTLVFADEFDGSGLDTTRWVTCYWWAIDGCNIGTNGELEWYQPGNVGVAGGVLQLTARPEAAEADDGRRFDYTSGMVSTGRDTSDQSVAPRFAFTYGWAEIRARLPSGKGLWPAFWLLPIDHESRPEIDVMEVLGDSTSLLRVHYHYIDDGERASLGGSVDAPDLSAGWHTYAVRWSPEHIVWYLDGIPRWSIDDPAIISAEPMYLILNLAVGGDYPGPPDASTLFPSTYEVDYIRVWQAP